MLHSIYHLQKLKKKLTFGTSLGKNKIPKIFVSHSPNMTLKLLNPLIFKILIHINQKTKIIGIGFWIYIHQTLDCLIDMIYEKVWLWGFLFNEAKDKNREKWSFQFLSIITWKINEIYKNFVNILNFLLIDCTIPTR